MIICDDDVYEEILSNFGKMVSSTDTFDIRKYQKKMNTVIDKYCDDGRTTCSIKENR